MNAPSGFGLDRHGIGWFVFSRKPNEIVKYGNVHVKWHVGPVVQSGSGYYSQARDTMTVSLSFDDGQTWTDGSEAYGAFKNKFGLYYWEDKVKHHLDPIIKSRDEFIRQRRLTSSRERSAKLKAMSADERSKYDADCAAELLKRQQKKEEQAGQSTLKAMNCLISVGPEFLKLKEKIERVVRLMEAGGINKPIPNHDRKLYHLQDANSLLNKYIEHMEKCQTGGKK